ncbi:pyridoxal-phosphate dependent enzyme [Streptomyces sp. NPDC059853]|uniref:pyridoxal-phosphate dependent enzyme n=1 Tax=Streptomyces sp. NPDC059853 TaxID=3346973 RepID=UPI00365B372E
MDSGQPRYRNPAARNWRCAPAPVARVRAFHRGLPGYRETPLVDLGGGVSVKDESRRMGLGAFKVLGASWALHRAGGAPERLVTATDGNHGRAVARLGRLRGVPVEVYVPRGVRPAAVAAIAAEGARVVRVDGDYDAAVARARAAGPLLVQDTAWPGYEEIPGWIVEGYATLFSEIDEQLAAAGAAPAGLVVVPAGVGSLAQAAVTHYRSGPATGPRPALLAVEPDSAACVLASLAAGEPVTVRTGTTAMAGLNCGTPSSLAWPYLRGGLDAAVTVTDARAAVAARELAGHGIDAGPCGAASLAAWRAAPEVAGRGSVVLLNTEGTLTRTANGM